MSYAEQIRVEPSAYKMRSLIADGIEENKAIADNAKETADNADKNATEAKEQVEINTAQWADYKQVMDADEAERKNNENTRITNENIRQANETSRQTVYNDFRDFVNSAEQINRVPYLFDGGDFGDSGDQGTWALSIEGGSF